MQEQLVSRPLRTSPGFASVLLFLILVELSLGLGAATAGDLPDAAHVATQLGKDVEFTDVIKAVLRSRSKQGCYGNFGAPYPKQVLSVWVPDDVYLLPRDPALLGREGRLESSPTGRC